MEGQNKRTEIQIECEECGGVFEAHPDSVTVICPECLEEKDWQ